MLLSEFDYHLPEGLIAQQPIEPRDASRLMVLLDGNVPVHDVFYNLPAYLKPGDTLVLNNTKVIPARLFGLKVDTNAKIEVFLLTKIATDTWEVLVRPGKKAKPGTQISFGDGQLMCDILETTAAGGRIVRFSYQGMFEDILTQL